MTGFRGGAGGGGGWPRGPGRRLRLFSGCFRNFLNVKARANDFNIRFNIRSILLSGNVESVCNPFSTALKRVE